MTAEQLIKELTQLVNQHGGDLPVTVAIGVREYSIRGAVMPPMAPAEHYEHSKKSPSERFVFEAKDDIPAA